MTEKNQKSFPKHEVENATLEYFNGDSLAADVWIRKYCLKDENNYYELTPDDMHKRLARELARIEAKYPNPLTQEQIYNTLKDFKRIIPQGSPMSGIGNDEQVTSLGNCFVIGNNFDSYGGIFLTDQEQAQLMKRRGGVGHDVSHLRPRYTPIKNDAITSTGIVPFMERYSNTTKEVAQDGRRGALMQSISIKHPEAESFIDAKMTAGKITGANISVKIHDDFMKSINNGQVYVQKFPIDSPEPKITKEINPKKLWDKIIHNAWESAEPGILFWDTLHRESISSCYGVGWIETSTNPCGELPLPPYDSCRLLAINLFGYVIDPFTSAAKFNWELFKKEAAIAERLMDDIVDLELEKIDRIIIKIKSDPEDEFVKSVELRLWEKIRAKAAEGRRTGLGITAEGDMLAALGYIYGTDEATEFSEKIHKTLKLEAYRSSVEMAKERGAFPIWDFNKEKDNPFLLRIKKEEYKLWEEMSIYGRRNIVLLTIAPTGSVSILAQTTSGIEPVFLPVYKRRRKINSNEKDVTINHVDDEGVAWTEYLVFHHKFKDWLEADGYDIEIVNTMSEEQLAELVKKSPYYKATSNDVDWVKKVEMQGRIQKHIDHSISVTVNLPKDATEEIVAKVYETGWESGCKGITVYRDGSREGVLISAETNKKEEMFLETHAPKRPKRLKGKIHRFQNNLEKWIAVIGLKDDRPFEIFTGKLENGLSYLPNGLEDCEVVKNVFEVEEPDEFDNTKLVKVRKKRYDIEYVDKNGEKQVHTGLNHAFDPEYWNYAKFISGVLRHGMPLVYVQELVRSLSFKEDHISTWKNGVVRTLKKHIADGEKSKGDCPECGGTDFIFKEGCLACSSCGYSKCD